MSSDSLYRRLSNSKTKYSEKLVRRSIVIIRNSTNEQLVKKHKDFIFDCLSKIIVKNINNFFNLIKNIDKGYVIHEKDDIVIECFIILDKCIEKFNLTMKDKKFYFYYNKSLSQGLYRLKEKNYGVKQNKYKHIDVNDVVNFDKTTFTHIKSYPLFLNKNFTNKEILLMQSKLGEEKIEFFCKKVEISHNEYYKILRSIKSKIDKKYFS